MPADCSFGHVIYLGFIFIGSQWTDDDRIQPEIPQLNFTHASDFVLDYTIQIQFFF